MIGKCGLLVALTGVAAWAQLSALLPHEPIFPSDTKNPEQVAFSELLQAVCPGQAEAGEYIGCRGNCPSFTGNSGLEPQYHIRTPTGFAPVWRLQGVILGHFLSPASEDAVLWMTGCEDRFTGGAGPRFDGFGGTILLSRQKNWTMLWYRPGVITAECHRVSVENPRENLVCVSSQALQGVETTFLYMVDLRSLTAGRSGLLFDVVDNMGTGDCGQAFGGHPLVRGSIDNVEFGTAANGGPLVSATVSKGEKSLTPEEAKLCEEMLGGEKPLQMDIFPTTKTYRLEFVFDGRHFEPAPESAATVHLLFQ